MSRILPSIVTLDQHLSSLVDQAESYRPGCCPHCGTGRLWCHGYYYRKADRDRYRSLRRNPIPIPRYYCKSCAQTCSRLPGCIAPRRWYLWGVQQSVLLLLLRGYSFRQAARHSPPGRHTVSRWWHRLKARFSEHTFYLRNRFVPLGRHADFASFWSACFEKMSLADAMSCLDRDGVVIP